MDKFIEELENGEISFLVGIKSNNKTYAARISFKENEESIDTQKVLNDVSSFCICSLATAMKEGISLTKHPSELNCYEIPKVYKCLNSPLYQKRKNNA